MRLECSVCGAKSGSVGDPQLPTDCEQQMLSEFAAEHNRTCAPDRIVYPEGAVTQETLAVQHVGAFGSKKPEPRSVRHPHGHTHRTGPYGELQECDTLSCCHCRAQWEVRVGSGKTRGFCALCFNGKAGSGYTCGHPDCDAHVPHEQRLWNLDHGLPALTPSAATISVPQLPSGLYLSKSLESTHGPLGAAASGD